MASLHASDSDQHEQPAAPVHQPAPDASTSDPSSVNQKEAPSSTDAGKEVDTTSTSQPAPKEHTSQAVTQPLHPLLSERSNLSRESPDALHESEHTPADKERPSVGQAATPEPDDPPAESVAPGEPPESETTSEEPEGDQNVPTSDEPHTKATAPLTSAEDAEEPARETPDEDAAQVHGLEIVDVPDPVIASETDAADHEATDDDDHDVDMAELETADISTDMFRQAGTTSLGEDSTQVLDTERAPGITTHRSHQMLAAAAHRDVGRVRQNNQDSVLSLLTYLPREGSDMPLGLFVVADGMGGHAGGEIASRLAIRTIVDQVFSQLVLPVLDDGMIEALQPMMIAALQEANHVIWNYAQDIGSDMGTTCTAALLLGRAFYIAHVGDSRAYLLQPGGLKVLTSDHSTVGRLIEMGQLDPSAAHDHPLRNQLYRTIGQQDQVEVDFIYQPIENSTHLLLCSDGLWGMVTDEHIEEALKRSPWPQDICDELIALANLAGGEDNISAVVVTLPVMERLRL